MCDERRQSTTVLAMADVADTDPLFVSPSNQEPSDSIASCLSAIFPNVPERAKQNNILLKKDEMHWLRYYINKFDSCCPDYDVTIVVDGGGSMEKEIQSIIAELGLKERDVERIGESCVFSITRSTHGHAALQLIEDATSSEDFRYWNEMPVHWGKPAIEMDTGSVCGFFDRFPEWRTCKFSKKADKKVPTLLECPEKPNEEVYKMKRPDASSAPFYGESLYSAFGMTPAPTLAIESETSDDIRKLSHDCIVWIAGALLQANSVIGVNNSPDTYSVDILNCDLTIQRMVELARTLEGEQYEHTRAALCQVIKMKSSIQILHLKLLDYMLKNPELCDGIVTEQELEKINRYLQGEITQAQELCPNLNIRPLELSRFPQVHIRRVQRFHDDIKAEIRQYKEILSALEDSNIRVCPQKAIVQCAYILLFHTMPMTFGPISRNFIPPQDVKLQIPVRALAGIGNGHVEIPPNKLEDYLCHFSPKQQMEQQTCKCKKIPLEWINDPHGLAVERGIPAEQMSPAKYDPRKTLGGKIRFCYLKDIALLHMLSAEKWIQVNENFSRKTVIWTLIQSQTKKATRKPLLKMVEAQDEDEVRRELGPLWRWSEFGRAPNHLFPSSFRRKGPMHPSIRGIHTIAAPLLPRREIHTTALPPLPRRGIHTTSPLPPRRGFYPKWYPRRVCGTLWTTVSRLPRH